MRWFGWVVSVALLLPAVRADAQTLERVRERGQVVCGVRPDVPGFASRGADGTVVGFDVEFCRAVAAAVLGDAARFRAEMAPAEQHFAALATGRIDLISGATDQTFRAGLGAGTAFLAITFHDSLSFLVPAAGAVKRLSHLRHATVCVAADALDPDRVISVFAAQEVEVKPLVLSSTAAVTAYGAGRCAAIAAPLAHLAELRRGLEDPAAHRIVAVPSSRLARGLLVRREDPSWIDIVRWSFYVLVNAEELGLTRANVDDVKAQATRPDVRRLLGLEGGLGRLIGLDDAFAYRIIQQVGNYGEVYNRYLGRDAPLNLPRGANAPVARGGLLFVPPFR